jgi:hypothetical protein
MPVERIFRWIIVGLFYFGFAGTAAELWLLEHTESFAQVAPFLVLFAAAGAMAWALIRPGPWSLRATQLATLAVAIVGAVGVYLHYSGNVAFELEMDPDRSGLLLVREALRGATPSLAPGLMVQQGLLGLAYTYRHPGLRSGEDLEKEES